MNEASIIHRSMQVQQAKGLCVADCFTPSKPTAPRQSSSTGCTTMEEKKGAVERVPLGAKNGRTALRVLSHSDLNARRQN